MPQVPLIPQPQEEQNEMTDIQLLNKYTDLIQKKRAGKFNWGAAMALSAIKGNLSSRGYVLSEDENTWYFPA